jgi:hypothetical protein
MADIKALDPRTVGATRRAEWPPVRVPDRARWPPREGDPTVPTIHRESPRTLRGVELLKGPQKVSPREDVQRVPFTKN